MKISVLSPHQDDAAFSVGLAIGAWICSGHNVFVENCFTKSRYSPFDDPGILHANDLQSYVTALRRKEDLRWSRKYPQPVSLNDLNLRDAPQRLQCGLDELCEIAPSAADPSITKIRRALERAASEALLIPLGLGDHVDHVTARLAAEGGWPESLPIAFYEDLPYAARSGVADRIPERARSIAPGLQPCFVCEPVDLEEAIERKRSLACCYDSQVDSETVEQIARFCQRYGGRERLWANRAWRESALGFE